MNGPRILSIVFAIAVIMSLFLPGCDELVTEVNNITIVDSTLAKANCIGSHNDTDNRFLRPRAQWANSAHASDRFLDTIADLNGVPYDVMTCGEKCHTHEGFLKAFDGLSFTVDGYNVIVCFTCHQPHTGEYGSWSDTTLRARHDYTRLANDSIYAMGRSNMCVHCHQAANPPAATDAEVTITGDFGPHHSGQADVLSGKGGYRFGVTAVENSHDTVITRHGCLRCHYNEGRGYTFGEHTFRLQQINGTDTSQFLTPCLDCHEGATDFYTIQEAPYNRIDSIDSLAGQLETALKYRAYLDPSDSEGLAILPDSTIPADAARILYNYLLYRLDGSRGIHNATFVQALLEESIEQLDSLPPISRFTTTTVAGCTPLAIDFTDVSVGDIVSWNWDFGDDVTSTLQNPSHIYNTAGAYTVKLVTRATNGKEDSVVTADYINAYTTTALFAATPTSDCDSLITDFEDQSLGEILSWEWDFGDGSALSAEQNPAHTYTTAGQFDVRLVVTDSCGVDTLLQPQYITVTDAIPVAAFAAVPDSGQIPLSVTFTDQSTGTILSWLWDFGDGSATSNDQHPIHLYNLIDGTFEVSLVVTNDCGSAKAVDTIIVTPLP
ncbi:MAG: PKD domain-containing protein [candidate division Zixibacteria bacterium]|nr:PKD domain-containing protein [candidate division Zixibacteria bacterium]